MNFDTLTLNAIAWELRRRVLGGRVQHIVLPDARSIALELYAAGRRHHLLASAHPQHARVHLVRAKVRRGVETETPLLLLLRKYVRGARLSAVEQPPWERILHLTFHGPEGATTLVVETMGRHSNILLLDEAQIVLDAVKRVTPQMSRVRPILPRTPYRPPPAQAKALPDTFTQADLLELLEAAAPDEPLWRVLVRGVAGISPLAAREIAFRATGNATAPVAAAEHATAVLAALQTLCAPAHTGAWQPTVVREGENVVAFAPYPLTHLGRYEEVESMSAAVETYYAHVTSRDAYAQARQAVQKLIDEARQRLERRREALQREHVAPEEVERLRRSGELILAYQWQIQPGQAALEVPYEPEGKPLRITLDPRLSPVENAQAYFRRYEKAKRAAQEVPAALAQVAQQLDYLAQLETDLQLAENRSAIDEVRELLEETGLVRAPRRRRKAPRSRPLRFEFDGFTVWVGRNARQNDELTFRRASPNDLWLHARGIPGAHVIVKTGGREVPEAVLQRAAQLAARYSAARDEHHVDVDVTQVRHVRRMKGGAPGQVVYRGERTLRVSPT